MASTTMAAQVTAFTACSWATAAKVAAPLEPPPGLEACLAAPTELQIAPGQRTRLGACRGQVLTMLSHHGWIMPLEAVDHEKARWRRGRVYVSKADVVCGSALAPGDIVGFCLYADDQGLGAEECHLEGHADAAKFSFSASAPEFVPLHLATLHQPGFKGAVDTAEADTDLWSSTHDDDGQSEDFSESDADSHSTAGLPALLGPAGIFPPKPVNMINLDSYEDCDDSDANEVSAAPSPTKPESAIGSAPWRALMPPGLPEPDWQRPLPGDAGILPSLPWRRK